MGKPAVTQVEPDPATREVRSSSRRRVHPTLPSSSRPTPRLPRVVLSSSKRRRRSPRPPSSPLAPPQRIRACILDTLRERGCGKSM